MTPIPKHTYYHKQIPNPNRNISQNHFLYGHHVHAHIMSPEPQLSTGDLPTNNHYMPQSVLIVTTAISIKTEFDHVTVILN